MGEFDLTQEDIDEFKKIMEEECGVTLSDHEAWNRAIELIALFQMLVGPIPDDQRDTSSVDTDV